MLLNTFLLHPFAEYTSNFKRLQFSSTRALEGETCLEILKQV